MHYHHRRHQHHGQHPQLHHGGHGVGPHHHTHNHKHKHNHKKHHAHHNGPTKVQVHPVQMMEALSAYNNSVAPVDFVIKENVIATTTAAITSQQQQLQQQKQQQNVMSKQQQSENNRQLDLHLAAISRMQQRSKQKTSHNQHKKVGLSRSHHPRISDSPTSNMVSTVPEGGLGSGNGSQIIMGLPVANFGEKPVLRKHRSFPYEMFNNEASYSSDDSLRN